MNPAPSIPGLYYTFVRPPATASPLRTDVAGFFGRTERGPVGVAVRVAGWREYASVFGTLSKDAMTPYALKGYFDNDGQVAHIIRLLGAGSSCATGIWTAGTLDASGTLNAQWPGASGLGALQYQIEATSPGDWANLAAIDIRYWAVGPLGKPELEFETTVKGESPELLSGVDPAAVADTVNAQSDFIRLTPLALPPTLQRGSLSSTVGGAPSGPNYFEWPRVYLTGGTAPVPTRDDYFGAVQALGDEIEVALVVSPDLYQDLDDASDQREVLAALLTQANALHDRLVIIDVPLAQADPIAAAEWVSQLRKSFTESALRNGAVYPPRLLVPDPLATATSSLRCTPCSGCVAGAISRQDIRLGAYFTPANTPIENAVDLSTPLDAAGQMILYNGGINLLTCSPGRGLLVWGGRVLGQSSPGGFVAHRRLIHLLVRAIRRVAEPLVFDTNGPQLWLAFVRSITTVLLEAYRAGALKGNQPSEAFRVACDATTNPPDQIDLGMVVCLIQIAPAVPMEFISLRVTVSAQGQLEVFET
jgi:uncharacterized protein